ncbi:hypothetical protein PLICRDRAFT_102628 [Plicaturopsis crispa FD-325 SS-3]|nr:hypothetical protein PLICRDRAFT_102628 [Plicaturopsis crispa FD-325 SS-3]
MEETPSQQITLQSQIQTLTDLYNRLHALRHIPTLLLHPPSSDILSTPQSQLLNVEFQKLKEIADAVRSETVQEALRTARDSEKADGSEINVDGRRENRKRRRPPSPESPQPFVSTRPKTASLFPVSDEDPTSLRLDELPNYIREFNRSFRPTKSLHVWTRSKPPPAVKKLSSGPVLLRFAIKNTITAFVTLGFSQEDPTLVVETVTAFGPRENKPPHLQSEYVVYQTLSQHIARMIQSHPCVSIQALIGLLHSYEGLFLDRCASCQRVLSAEGYLPPVARIISENNKDHAIWEPRHANCLQN